MRRFGSGLGFVGRCGGGRVAALTTALPHLPFPGLGIKPRPAKRRGCGNCVFAASAPGGAKPQFPRRSIHSRSRSNPLQVFQKRSPRHKAGASLLADRVGFPACGRAASGCSMPPACCQEPSVRIPPSFYANSPTLSGGTICMSKDCYINKKGVIVIIRNG